MKELKIFVKRFGWFGFVRLVFYPLTALVTTPFRLMQTLWNCRILADGRWGDYSHFIPSAGINSLCYWNPAMHLYKFGRTGCVPHVGTGNYSLSRYFCYTLISLYSYLAASTITVLVGMFGWLLAHLVWMQQIGLYWVIIVMSLAVISTTFYANTFALQNYNALGWLFFPLGIYGIVTQNWIIAGIAWFLASFCSITVVSMGGVLSIVSAVINLSVAPVFAMLPAGLKLSTHFYSFLSFKDIKSSFLSIAKSIGIYRRNVKYKHHLTAQGLLTATYFLFLYIQFFIVAYWVKGEISIFFLTGLGLFIANSTYLRFADVQSTQMLMFSLATAIIIQNPTPALLLSYWILISPLPLLIPFPFMDKVLDVVPKLAPFAIRKLSEDMGSFLAPVKTGEKVLMAFDNPRGSFENLFDGYRVLLELSLYVSSKKGIHFMPDWWIIHESNYEGAPDFWGRDIDSVSKNIKRWKADYVVIYQNAGTTLELLWEEAGFKVLSKFSWVDHEEDLRGMKPYDGETPDWWLMKIPQDPPQ